MPGKLQTARFAGLALALWPVLAFTLLVTPARAQNPGDACLAGQAGHLTQTGGTGAGALMVCESLQWRPILGYNAQGGITAIGNLTCTNGQVLSYNGTQWACADASNVESVGGLPPPPAGQISCTRRSGTNNVSCNAGETMTGGGCSSSNGTANLRTNSPSAANTWSCTYSGGTVTAYAICCTL